MAAVHNSRWSIDHPIETGSFQFRAEARERICSRSSSTAKTGVVSSLTAENYFIWNGHYA